jgi:enoyl-CoA hydratase/carnithine racemase
MGTFATRQEGRVLHLRFGAPSSLNLMTDEWFADLERALRAAGDDPQVRSVCLSAEGRSFSGGGDLKGFLAGPWREGVLSSGLARCLELLERFDKPIVAAVHGAAIGGGVTVLLHCDFVYAEPETRFQLPFTRIGIVPELGSTFLLPQFAGQRLALELVLLGRPFDAATALRAGIVNEVTAAGQARARAEETAGALAQLPPGSLRSAKRLIKSARGGDYATAWRDECRALEKCLAGEEVREACRAFLEKREADFSRFQ